jgi:hypothetical protein
MAPSAQTVIKQAYTQHVKEQERKRDETLEHVDFDHYSKEAWHAMHTSDAAKRWVSLNEMRRDAATKRTVEKVVGCVAEMKSQIRETTSFDVKLNALETVRKVLKSILLGSNELAQSVRSALRDSGVGIGDDVVIILMCMTEEEMVRAAGTADEKGTLAQKFRWCRDEAKKYGLRSLQGLDTVLEMMRMPVCDDRWE